LSDPIIGRLEHLAARHQEIEKLLSQPEIAQDAKRFQALAKEMSSLGELVKEYRHFTRIKKELEGVHHVLQDLSAGELKQLAEEDERRLEAAKAASWNHLEELLLEGEDLHKDKNVIVEIRAGTGGEEAALFVADLFRMYSRYAQIRKLNLEVLDMTTTGIGGMKEVIFSVAGHEAYKRFKFEGGIHRVQRVPATEASGRIHTSAVTVAVLPEADEVEVEIDPKDIRVDVFRSGGPGGQSVNTTDSAVRITHIPTGLVVSCQDEKSQHKNKAKGLRILRARLLEKMQDEQSSQIAKERRDMVGTGDRSGKSRTYNFHDNRVTDHRIGLTIHDLDGILEGNLDQVIEPLLQEERARKLAEGKKA